MHGDLLPEAVLPAGVPASTGTDAARAALAATLLAIAVVVGCYGSTAAAMVEIWARSDTFAHGFIVPPIAIWLIWRQRRELAAAPLKPSPAVLALVAIAGACWLAGQLAQVNALRQFAMVAIVALATPAIAGIAPARRILFPLGFLLFAVPFGEFLLPQLMDWTALFTVAALQLTGIPVYREGLRFVIPSGTWSVVEACSGVRYLIASLMVGTLFAYLTYRSLRRRMVFVAVSIAVPIVANWLRAYLIVLLGHLSSNRLAVGVDHLIYGWLFFGVVMMLMFWVGSRWREDDIPAPSGVPGSPGPVAVARAPAAHFWIAAAAFVLVAAAPVAIQQMLRSAGSAPESPLLQAIAIGEWRSAPTDVTGWRPHFVAPTTERFATYAKDGRPVGLYIAVYRDQSEARKLVTSENTLVKSDDQHWARTARETHEVRLAESTIAAQAADLRSETGERLRAWQWYWVDGRATGSGIEAKLYELRAQLLGRGNDAAAVVIVTPMGAEPNARSAADETLAAFAAAAAQPVARTLAATLARR